MSKTNNTQIKLLKSVELNKKLKEKREKKRLRQLKLNKKHLRTAKQFEDYTWMEMFK